MGYKKLLISCRITNVRGERLTCPGLETSDEKADVILLRGFQSYRRNRRTADFSFFLSFLIRTGEWY